MLSALPEDYSDAESQSRGDGAIADLMHRHAQLANPAGELRLRLVDTIIARFGAATDPELRAAVARAVFLRASILHRRERVDEAIQAWDAVERLAGVLLQRATRGPVQTPRGTGRVGAGASPSEGQQRCRIARVQDPACHVVARIRTRSPRPL